jgi:hypothetical protein
VDATQREALAEGYDIVSYVRVGILGTTTGGEVWSVNPTFDPTAEFPGPVDQSKLDAAAQAIANLTPGSTLLTGLSTAMSIVGARLEVRDDGTDNLLALSIAGRGTALPGITAPKMPAQTASVVSLRTNTPGGSGRGRMYWPGLGYSLGTNLRLGSATTSVIVSEMKTYLAEMDAALTTQFAPISFDLAIRSRATHTTPHVVRIQVGDVLDTQRRRRDTLAESYQTLSIP